jgi:hypothetical protein
MLQETYLIEDMQRFLESCFRGYIFNLTRVANENNKELGKSIMMG